MQGSYLASVLFREVQISSLVGEHNRKEVRVDCIDNIQVVFHRISPFSSGRFDSHSLTGLRDVPGQPAG